MQGRTTYNRWTRTEADENSAPNEPVSLEDQSEFVSLEELGNVYAKVLQGESPSVTAHKPSDESSSSLDFHGSIIIHGETDGIPVSVWSIIESILFVGTRDGRAITLEELKLAMKEFSEEEILRGIEQLQTNLESQNASVRVNQDQNGYRLTLTEDLDSQIEQLKWGIPKEAVLSQTAIDCLSLVAYQPGIQRTAIENQLGQGVSATLSLLQRRGLIELVEDGFHTTERFLEVAGIDSLDDLPKADDL